MEEIQRIHAFLEAAPDIRLAQDFQPCPSDDGSLAAGEIKVEVEGGEFSFRVEVPRNFPLSGLRFFYQGDSIARHLLRGGMVCVSSSFSDCFDEKLKWDFAAIREWVETYILHPKGNHYEYLPINRNAVFMLFDEMEAEIRLKHGDHGEFRFMELPRGQSMNEKTYIALEIGGRLGQWSEHYLLVNRQKAQDYWKSVLLTWAAFGNISAAQMDALVELFDGKPWPPEVPQVYMPSMLMEHAQNLLKGNTGLYYFLDHEPLNAEGKAVRTLGELHNLFSVEFKALLDQRRQAMSDAGSFVGTSGLLFIMIGYPIPDKQEIHWELLLYPIQLPAGTGKERRKQNQLSWGHAVNTSYNRFFGRGRLVSGIVESKVLIIGLGAVGSAVASTLVRGGARFIALSDYDHVEAGNICRSTYAFDQIHRPKSAGIMQQLMLISPFVTVSIESPVFSCYPEQNEVFEEVKKSLSAFDLIFDCTADDSVAWMLDQLQLDATIVNLSITDEAQHLVAVTNAGKSAILPAKRRIFSGLDQTGAKATFYEGQGCWHPTFKASFADINLLLQQYIADANHRLTRDRAWTTTVLETIKGDFGLRVTKKEDV